MRAIRSDASAGVAVCQARGYCGPFINAERYSAIAGWDGIADCAVCGNTVQIERHFTLWMDTMFHPGSSRDAEH